MKRLRIPVAFTFCVLGVAQFVTPNRAFAATDVVDQSFAPASGSISNFPLYMPQSLGQSFTAGVTGQLDRVSLDLLRSGDPGPVTVQIETTSFSGAPSGTVLATATIPESSTSTAGYGWVSATLNQTVPITAGTQYVILATAGGSGTNWYAWQEATSPGYAGGQMLFAPAGGSWTPYPSADLFFQTYVLSLPTSLTQCFNGGWKNWPQFKNQGDCVSYIASHDQG